LASILTQAFDDCATIYGRFKLLDSFDELLERPIIQDELERKQISLVQAYGQDLKRVQVNTLRCDPWCLDIAWLCSCFACHIFYDALVCFVPPIVLAVFCLLK
jgi:hypothetical protein